MRVASWNDSRRFMGQGAERRGNMWMKKNLSTHVWVFGGDWNTVESFEDSTGDPPVQVGDEHRRWQELMAE
ncbi:hypothetical protein R1sor_022281 [Riccia sorocarpa]|uniref:Uncharacterized protein n=1 Tax=Riccia sorocarpa TaxID=122646 RepID=A0ABD3GMK8_9MARC